ncbi:MAG: FAD-dependent oxidoreductase, partial [Pseudomonadales bacterium]
RGWHPEKIEPKGKSDTVLVVGAGPAGLEAARALGQRGYQVMLAEATRELGGRVSLESNLPGLSEWARVREHRVAQIEKMSNVEIYRESELAVQDVLDLAVDHVAIATGSKWRSDAFGNYNNTALDLSKYSRQIYTADHVMTGSLPTGRTIIFDDDCFYLGSLIAEKLKLNGNDVVYLSAASQVAAWSANNGEQARVQLRLIELEIELVLNHGLDDYDGKQATVGCVYSERQHAIPADNIVMVTARTPQDKLYYDLLAAMESSLQGAPQSARRIGDCDAPGLIAAAVYSGHKYARELDTSPDPDAPAKIDRIFYEEI